jgi:AcrR family transcriptional regulator
VKVVASNTRQRLVESAHRRFYRDGFRNVGLDQILDDVGISRTAFYKHFESKDDLMLAVLEMLNRWIQDQFRAMVREHGGRSAAGQLRGMFDVVERVINTDGFHGCIFVNAAMEFPLPHDPAHAAAARNKRAIEDIVHELAERAGAADPQALAEEMCLIIEGVYVTRHVSGRPETIAIARRLADRLLAAHLPERLDPPAPPAPRRDSRRAPRRRAVVHQ